ncbi:penicillin-binding protein [Subdoligranulum sp. OF01-18]|nr:penicillin-binding protein [Subdoligranulum sp. OF01-18]
MRRAGSTFGRRLIIENNKNGAQRPAQGAPRGAQGSGGPRRNKKKKMTAGRVLGAIMRFIASCLCVCIILGSVAAVAVSLYVVKETQGDSDLLDLTQLELAYTTIIYSQQINDQGQPEWVEYQRLQSPEENRIWKPLNEISPYIQHAFVAVEDENFYTHPGFSFKRTVLAAINEVFRKLTGSYLTGSQLGASTIEQQLIKNITGEDESSGIEGYARKVKEIFRAIALDNRFSKEEILEAYLNTIGLTGNTAGVEAGANQYFGKSAADVTIAEAASIAAITKNPSRFNPYTNPEEHLKRRDDIILFMQQQGYITQAEAEAAWATPLNLVEKTTDENAAVQTDYSWFTDQVISEVIDDLVAENPLGRENWDRAAANDYLYNGGLRIYSTVDTEVQTALENVWLEGKYWEPMPIENYDDPNNPDDTPRTITTQAAGVVINYKGELCGVVGGLGQKTENRGFNRGTEMERQVGSTMKGVAAYPLGIDMDLINYSSVLMDDYFPISDGKGGTRTDWPSNWSGRYSHSMTTVYEALKQSLNTVAVRVGDWVTPRTMFEFARETLGITTLDENSDVDLAPMVLGATTTGLSPYELAGAYMMYGDGGRMTSLHSYTSVRDYQGNEILEKDIVTTQAIGEDTAYIMNRLLHSVLFDAGGTARGIHPDANIMDSIGKTGTTNDNKDVWFVGLTPKYVMATWYGYDENEPMDDYNNYYIYKNKGSQKGHPGASAFAEVMDTVQADDEIVTWDMPETVEKGAFCTISGDIPTDGCPRGTGYYKTGVQRGVCTGIHATDPAA